jgi:hypothetical protein
VRERCASPPEILGLKYLKKVQQTQATARGMVMALGFTRRRALANGWILPQLYTLKG